MIASWSNLLNWSENAAAARRMQEEIAIQKQLLDTIAVDDNGEIFDTEEAIREKIQELKVNYVTMISIFGEPLPDLGIEMRGFLNFFQFSGVP